MDQVEIEERPRGEVVPRGDEPWPGRFALILLVAVTVPVAVLYAVPQTSLPWPAGLLLIAVLLVTSGGAVGFTAGSVLRAAAARTAPVDDRGAGLCFAASGLSFLLLCVIAPGAAVIALGGVTSGWQGLDARSVTMTSVASAALLLAAVFAIAGLVLLPMTTRPRRLAWAKVDLAVQLWALGIVLATIAVLY